MTEAHEGRGVRPAPDAFLHKRGTLAEMVAELLGRAEYLDHKGDLDKAEAAREAAQGLQEGSFCVRLGVTTYTVEGDASSTLPGQASTPDVS